MIPQKKKKSNVSEDGRKEHVIFEGTVYLSQSTCPG